MSRIVSKDGLAEHIDISPRTVEKWTRERRIPFIRISPKCVRYDLDAIDELLAERTVPIGGTGARKAVSSDVALAERTAPLGGTAARRAARRDAALLAALAERTVPLRGTGARRAVASD